MRNLLLTTTAVALFGFGMVLASPAFAGMTPDQLAAEGWPAASPAAPGNAPGQQTGAVAGTYVGGPLNPNNGLAQDRITGSEITGSQVGQ